MEEIKNFIARFINTEQRIEETLRNEDLKTHNELVEQVFSISGDGLKLFNIHEAPLSDSLLRTISRNKNSPVRARHLYKISEYKNKDYGKVWACYTSVKNPIAGNVKSLSNYFVVAYIQDTLKIIAQFVIDRDTNKWRFVGGDRNIKTNKAKDLIAVERLMSPEIDEDSITEYLKDN